MTAVAFRSKGVLESFSHVSSSPTASRSTSAAEGIRHDVIDACFQLGGQDDLVLLVARVRALQDFLATEDGDNLLTGYKRATNILEQEEKKDGVEYSLDPDPRFAETDAERALFAALDAAEAAIGPALAAEDFAAGDDGARAPARADRRLLRHHHRQRRRPGRAAQPALPAQPHPRGDEPGRDLLRRRGRLSRNRMAAFHTCSIRFPYPKKSSRFSD